MAYIPSNVREQSVIPSMRAFLLSQGKVGDKYCYPSDGNRLISVRSDRLSVFDFVLLLLVLYKGQVLTGLTDFWARVLLDPLGIKHHLVRSEGYSGRNMAKDLKEGFPDIDLTRTMVVRKANIMPFELIFRHHIGGSVWNKYEKNGIVAGVKLPAGLKKWQKLDEPLFTPSTKAEGGHDVNITQDEFFAATGKEGRYVVDMLTELYMEAYRYCDERGISLLDTKFESDGKIVCDEWLTPDSSRYVAKDNLEESLVLGEEPAFMDKQPARDYCATIETPFVDGEGKRIIGFKDLKPENPEHVEFVSNYELPDEVALSTTRRYLEIFELLTGEALSNYQQKYML